ncbi:Chromosome partitioning protein ParA [Clostridium sp. C105KSO15]|nr:Chromosome partitioning protein ParA [Clostridium sp. C105KSO15]
MNAKVIAIAMQKGGVGNHLCQLRHRTGTGGTAADSVIIPVQAQYLPAKGLEQLLQTINKVRKQINPKLQIDGIRPMTALLFLMILAGNL